MCATPLTRSLACVTEISSLVMLTSLRTLTTNQSRQSLYQLQAQHRHELTQTERDSEHDQKHEQNDNIETSNRPKSFKELVAMQQRARQSHRPDDHPIVSHDEKQ